MTSPIESAIGRKLEGLDSAHWVTVKQASELVKVSPQAIRQSCARGHYKAIVIRGNGGQQYRIDLASLPAHAQVAYYSADRGKPKTGDLFGVAHTLATETTAATTVTEVPTCLDQAQREALWEDFDRKPKGIKDKAQRNLEVVLLYESMKREGIPQSAILAQLQAKVGTKGLSAPQVWRLRKRVAGHDRADWLPLLAPDYKGRTVLADFTEEAWLRFVAEYGRTTQPALAPILRRLREEGRTRGWQIPCDETVRARWNALPQWRKVFLRQGPEALERMHASQRRDYSGLTVNGLWCADGHKADFFVRFPEANGKERIARPILVGWVDLRSRVLMGFAVGQVESADLIRAALKQAIDTAGVIPQAALMDNGRGFASKLLTGGIPNRYRFKVKEEEVPGILTCMGIEVIWALPGRGQSKPIERWWGTLTSNLKARPELSKAWCGNRPDARPEDFDPKNAVSLELFLAVLSEEINAYHARGHRGDSMHGKSPREVYDDHIAKTPCRQPTAAQARLLLLAAERVKLNPSDHAITILENRYWCEDLAALDPRGQYTARFNPENARDPLALYLGERYLFDVPLREAVGFRDQEAAKAHAKARTNFRKARKAQARAYADMRSAEDWTPGPAPAENSPKPTPLPAPPVVSMVRPQIEMPRTKPVEADEQEENLLPLEEMNRRLAEARRKRASGT